MVLQRDRPIRIWGTAPPGVQLRVSMENRVTVVRADQQGHWVATMGSVAVGGPYELEIRSDSLHKLLRDVWVGEVWLCVGQSNMEWPLYKTANSTTAIANADLPRLRYFKIPNRMAMQPQEELRGGSWLVSSTTSAPHFSGVAYHFAQTKIAEEGIPVGIIEATWGATAIHTWMGPRALHAKEGLTAILSVMDNLNIASVQDSLQIAEENWRQSFASHDLGLREGWEQGTAADANWPLMEMPQTWEQGGPLLVDGVVWFKKDFVLDESQVLSPLNLSLGILDDQEEAFINGYPLTAGPYTPRSLRSYSIPDSLLKLGTNTLTVRISDFGYVGGFLGSAADLFLQQGEWQLPLAGPWRYQWGTPDLPAKPRPLSPNTYPGLLYNGMIHPLTNLTIAGILWYQGESDLNNPFHYRDDLLNLIDDYRMHWKLGDFPFLIAQLPYFRNPLPQPAESGWATMRESQQYPLQRRRVGLVPLIDQGAVTDIHPANKAIVGKRFFLLERLLREKTPDSYGGAMLQRVEQGDSCLLLHFSEVGTGLVSSTPDHLPGFAVAGEDGVFYWAEATLVSSSGILVSSPLVDTPRFVRYAWADNPGPLALFDGWQLPLPPFRTDDFKVPWE